MHESCRPLAAIARVWLLALLGHALIPAMGYAQVTPPRTWTVVPLLGFGAVLDNGNLESAGMESALDIEYGGTRWRWSGYSSLRGLGVGCSHACFDGGPAVTIGVSRSLNALWIGGGVGGMRQLGAWHVLPYGRLSLEAAPFRLDVRLELPPGTGQGIYVPLLIGFPVSE